LWAVSKVVQWAASSAALKVGDWAGPWVALEYLRAATKAEKKVPRWADSWVCG
jgi:hypothetical protein